MAARYEKLPSAEIPELAVDFPNVRDVLRHRGPLEATLPPTPIRELLAASGATLFVLATDAALVSTVRRAADHHPLFVVETWPELLAAVASGRCGIALVDASLLGARFAQCVAALAVYADRLVTLVAADRAAAPEFVGFLSDGRIYRLVMKPLAVGATRLLIESATARRLQLREEPANDGVPNVVAAASSRSVQSRWRVFAAGGSVVTLVAVATAAGWLGGWERLGVVSPRDPVAEATATAAAAVEALPAPADPTAELRGKAALARSEGRLAEPVGDSALDHYLAILAVAPGDQEARNGISTVVETLFTRAEEALLVDSLEAAAAALDHVRRADPASSRLAFLDAQLTRSLAALTTAPPVDAAQTPVAAAPTELDSALSLAMARLRRGQLLDPAGDSASAYLARAAELNGTDPRVAALRTDLANALIAAARIAIDSDIAAAANLASEARRLGINSRALTALESDLAALAREGELAARLDTARARVQSGALFAPAGDSALDYLTPLQTDAPDLTGLSQVWEAFRDGAALAIRGTIERGEWAVANAQLAGLAQAPGGEAAAMPLAAELAAGQLQESYLATASPASVLTLETATPAAYPLAAIQRNVEGWVDLEFVVDRSGQPRNLGVVEASPAGVFDSAAVAAVEQYRYVPFEQDGRLYERRLRLRVRFQLQ